MTYLKRFTFDALPKAGIDTLVGMKAGDTVWNTTNFIIEIYNGKVWVNDDCIVLLGGEASLQEGHIVNIASDGKVVKASTSEVEYAIGIVVRGGGIRDSIVIAQKGIWPVQFQADTVLIEAYCNLGVNDGLATESSVGSIPTIGICMEGAVTSAGDKLNVMIQIKETY